MCRRLNSFLDVPFLVIGNHSVLVGHIGCEYIKANRPANANNSYKSIRISFLVENLLTVYIKCPLPRHICRQYASDEHACSGAEISAHERKANE